MKDFFIKVFVIAVALWVLAVLAVVSWTSGSGFGDGMAGAYAILQIVPPIAAALTVGGVIGVVVTILADRLKK